MALTDAQKLTFRKTWLFDYWDGTTTPPTAFSDYNRVNHENFFDDDQIDDFYDQVIAENPRLFTAYTDQDSTTQDPLALDVQTGIYRAMRSKMWSQQLVDSRFMKAMYSGGASEEAALRIQENMRDILNRDALFKINNRNHPQSIELMRG